MTTLLLYSIFFLSGASALIFETLWFRGAGLMLGNSVWASSLAMASFMAGLALGNVFAGRVGDRSANPVRLYAVLEVIIGTAGLGLVLLFPALTPVLAPALRPFLDTPAVLNVIRLAIAFFLMLLPAVAMGSTLPVLVSALTTRESDFGRVVGLLYGWNTLGAVAGALAGEAFLVDRYGVRGAGLAACSLNLLAALGAMALSRRPSRGAAPGAGSGAARTGPGAAPLLAAAFLAGGLLLALEVLWFRFLLMFAFGTSLVFAIMLATALLGIGLGSLGASLWLRLRPSAHHQLPIVAILAGVATVLTYSGFVDVTGRYGNRMLTDAGLEAFFRTAARLMLPTSILSGAFFSLLAKRLRDELPGEARPAAALTVANTAGATAGALLGGFLLLPVLGLERSFFAAACGYGVVALAVWLGRERGRAPSKREAFATVLAALGLGGALALFPFGLMRNHFVPVVASRWPDPGVQVAAVREGLTETIVYLRRMLWGEAVYVRLLANGFSMSASTYASRRYMNVFVYLPVALHPSPKRALLISYGLGSTAKALTDTASIESLDVVDISRDILEMGRIVFPAPGEYPLDDPRVKVHVEDGRFFLLTTDRRYDLITAEPPPPKNAGVGNLYSREYFQLVHDRLAEGGFASYWLPVYQLEPAESEAVIRAFCDAFDDCSLWTGYGLEWILLGSRGATQPPGLEGFTRQWSDPAVGPTLRALALERPEQLGALFLADASELRRITGKTPPLDDDHPHRIAPREPAFIHRSYVEFMETRRAREGFAASPFIRRMWPSELKDPTLVAFRWQAWLNRFAVQSFGWPKPTLRELAECLTGSPLRTLPLWILESSVAEQGIAERAARRGVDDPRLHELFGARALVDRDYAAAAERFGRARPDRADAERIAELRALAYCLVHDTRNASAAVESARALHPKEADDWRWLSGYCGVPSPLDPPPAAP